MAVRRRLGNLAQMLLQSHLIAKRQQEQSEGVRLRQIEAAEQNRKHEERMAALRDPQVAKKLGMKDLAPTRAQEIQEVNAPIDSAKSIADLPTGEGLFSAHRAQTPGDISKDLIDSIRQRASKEQGIKSGMTPTAVEDIDPTTGVGRKRYVNPLDTADLGPLQTERTPEQEGAREGGTELAKLKTPGLTDAKVTEANKLETGTAGAKARTAGMVAGAQERARLAEELRPEVLAKKLEFERQKRMAELAGLGDKIQAEQLAAKSAAVKGLMPVYQQYRELALKVIGKAGELGGPAGMEWTAGGLNAISKLPVVGEFAGAAAEALHAGVRDLVPIGDNPEDAKNIALLNRLTDTLAQGMANAVLGNKGQTTENDRRTAKNILVNSFTSVKSGLELLAITDRMFGLMPSVAAAKPDATPAEILTEVAKQAGVGGGAQTATPNQAPQSDPKTTGRAKLGTLRSR